MEIRTPHIPLNAPLEQGLKVLEKTSELISKEAEGDCTFYKVSTPEFECGFYAKDNVITAVWYSDPLGRGTQEGIDLKVRLYLGRYGELDDWVGGVNNGWIQFFTNRKTNVVLAYGLHKDVLRFNYRG